MISFFLCLLAAAAEPQSSTRPLSYLVLTGDDVEFDAAITDVQLKGQTERTLNIVCQKGCASNVSFLERVDDYPLGMFRLSDQEDILLTTWVSGSAYKVRGYHLTGARVDKVLDVSSATTPTITLDLTGHSVITVTSRPTSQSKLKINTWIWVDNRYKLSARNRVKIWY